MVAICRHPTMMDSPLEVQTNNEQVQQYFYISSFSWVEYKRKKNIKKTRQTIFSLCWRGDFPTKKNNKKQGSAGDL